MSNSDSNKNEVEITEPVICIRINELFRDDMSATELYNATRSCWKVSLDSVNKIDYALSVYKGIVQEVYYITEWIEADPTAHEKNLGRFEFIGGIAENNIRNKYRFQSIKHYFKKGNARSFFYINK